MAYVCDRARADTVLASLKAAGDASTKLYNSLPSNAQPAFFELVQHPVQASLTLQNMYIAAAINNLRALQYSVAANMYKTQVENLFSQDYDLENKYHTILDGTCSLSGRDWKAEVLSFRKMVSSHVHTPRWLLTLLQESHDGPNAFWLRLLETVPEQRVCYFSATGQRCQTDLSSRMPAVQSVQAKKQNLAGPMRITIEGSMGAWCVCLFAPFSTTPHKDVSSRPGDDKYSCASGTSCGSPVLSIDSFNPFGNRFIDISSGGPAPFTFDSTSNVSWVKVSPSSGSISPSSPEQRVFLSVDWSKVSGQQTAKISFKATPQGLKTQTTSLILHADHKSTSNGFHGSSSVPSDVLTKPALTLGVPLRCAT